MIDIQVNQINVDVTVADSYKAELTTTNMSVELVVPEVNVDVTVSDNYKAELTTTNMSVELVVPEVTNAVSIDVGLQGPQGVTGLKGDKGDVGDTLEFQALTEQQKIELRGDVGNTSTNYTNLFNSVLLS